MIKKTSQFNYRQNNNNEHLELIINTTGVGIWDWQVQTGALTFNERWAEIIGYTFDELYPIQFDAWSSNLHPDDFKKAKSLLEKNFDGDLDLYEVEIRVKHKSGHYVWVLASGKLIERDDEGQPKRMIGTHLDITERKNNALKLHEKEERLSLATVLNGVGVWDLNPQAEELIWDDSMFSLFNIKKKDFSGAYDAWSFLLHPDDRKRAERELHTALSGGKDFETDFRVVWSNGEIRIIKAIAKVFRDKAGKPIRMLGINVDVTDLKLSEEKLKLAAKVFTHARESITITDTTGTIIDVNDTFTITTGYSREEVIGQNPRILKSGRQSSEFYADMWQILLKEDFWSGEVWNRRKNGEVYAVMKTISAVRDEHGITTHYVSLGNDITKMKEHQNQLERIAHYDILTNLPNRSLLADRLSQAMMRCSRQEQSLAVVFLDLDGFKAVNDTYGHDVGDELLIALSVRMKEALREGDSLARIRTVISRSI